MPLLYGTTAAAGSDQSGAAAVVSRYTQVTGADGSAGVRLPGVTPGAEYYVYNATANSGLKVYPASGDDINDGSADAAVTIEGKTLGIFIGLDTSTWGGVFTADS
jgi:hypothetical protein